ncbi:Oidioi.mRNA.OKI2018_I69.YSR.g17053.t1.cds [Oikopleura dioica]|uniref:Oidioi.mRNA.OKI2018_I69.YSR.g17053.t1.cds n=1 Tax=Oikopleura dioica TaxID=34765 RepID=A0ABN7SII9_OIKDI|nr:Oidioi.mRNA.OKI2018_I69.YSR.g17053.t1.cds [Oikopleura dioica]
MLSNKQELDDFLGGLDRRKPVYEHFMNGMNLNLVQKKTEEKKKAKNASSKTSEEPDSEKPICGDSGIDIKEEKNNADLLDRLEKAACPPEELSNSSSIRSEPKIVELDDDDDDDETKQRVRNLDRQWFLGGKAYFPKFGKFKLD